MRYNEKVFNIAHNDAGNNCVVQCLCCSVSFRNAGTGGNTIFTCNSGFAGNLYSVDNTIFTGCAYSGENFDTDRNSVPGAGHR